MYHLAYQEFKDAFISIYFQFMSQFDGQTDPVNYAIDCGKEKIAKYLVEKAFSLHHIYWVSCLFLFKVKRYTFRGSNLAILICTPPPPPAHSQ